MNDFLSASISTVNILVKLNYSELICPITFYIFLQEEIDTSVGPTNGLFGWIGKKIASQTESSVTAVSLVWWISSMLSTAVNRLVNHSFQQ